MNVLVIGYGSIGKRHCKILSDLDCNVAVISRHNKQLRTPYPSYNNLDQYFDKHTPDYIVIANETSSHLNTISKLAKTTLFQFGKQILELVKSSDNHLFCVLDRVEYFVRN